MTKKVYIEQGRSAFTCLFNQLGYTRTYHLCEANLVVFTGGSDVNPAMYGEPKHPFTHFDEDRDKRERILASYCLSNLIPMVGICRGGQFLNVMCGGKLLQHVEGHAEGPTTTHPVRSALVEGEFLCSSTHHQMMVPGKDGELVAHSNLGTRAVVYNKTQKKFTEVKLKVDVESVYYKWAKILCFQPHPEYHDKGHGCNILFRRLLEETIERKE